MEIRGGAVKFLPWLMLLLCAVFIAGWEGADAARHWLDRPELPVVLHGTNLVLGCERIVECPRDDSRCVMEDSGEVVRSRESNDVR